MAVSNLNFTNDHFNISLQNILQGGRVNENIIWCLSLNSSCYAPTITVAQSIVESREKNLKRSQFFKLGFMYKEVRIFMDLVRFRYLSSFIIHNIAFHVENHCLISV